MVNLLTAKPSSDNTFFCISEYFSKIYWELTYSPRITVLLSKLLLFPACSRNQESFPLLLLFSVSDKKNLSTFSLLQVSCNVCFRGAETDTKHGSLDCLYSVTALPTVSKINHTAFVVLFDVLLIIYQGPVGFGSIKIIVFKQIYR